LKDKKIKKVSSFWLWRINRPYYSLSKSCVKCLNSFPAFLDDEITVPRSNGLASGSIKAVFSFQKDEIYCSANQIELKMHNKN
jgi:hypothetical protein